VAAACALIGLAADAPPRRARAEAPGPVLPEMVTPETVKAIDRGLTFLARRQRKGTGNWVNTAGSGYGSYPTVMTSLASLALMAGGSTPETGPYAKHVKRGMNYVLNVAEAHGDGLIAGPGHESRSMYGHGFGMLFLAHCYGTELSVESEKRLKKVLDKAVSLTAQAQSRFATAQFPAPYKEAGGWIYTPTGNGDEGSVTVTQLQALRACRNAGINVPEKTINKAVAYLRHCQNNDGGISYSARSRGGSRPAISAAAVACFFAAGVYGEGGGGRGFEAQMIEKLVDYVKRTAQPERNTGHYFYTQLYMAEAMYQRGEKDWADYFVRIRDRMLALQNADGSWQGDSVGTVYGTAIACIILQLPYGYLPICER
jgi:hypothetical protein